RFAPSSIFDNCVIVLMAGGRPIYRHLSRSSSHRQALLRNLVTSLFKHETISTTWHKAKEAQRMAEKLVTLAKKNTEASRRRAHQIFYVRHPGAQGQPCQMRGSTGQGPKCVQ